MEDTFLNSKMNFYLRGPFQDFIFVIRCFILNAFFNYTNRSCTLVDYLSLACCCCWWMIKGIGGYKDRGMTSH